MLVEMAIKGLMVDPVTNMPIVLLRDADNQRVLPIWVGPVEANAIALQIENVAPPRPMTHDLFRNVLTELGATLERVVISDLRESTFFAYLELRRGGELLLVDARPSDAIALASLGTACCLIIRQGVTPVSSVRRALDDVKHLPMLGVMLNQNRTMLPRWVQALVPQE